LPKSLIRLQKINVDNQVRFRYQVGYWFRLIDASICGVKADADTQLTVFDSSALKKQLLIFHCCHRPQASAGGSFKIAN
jgi:hypothetical protein